MTEAIRAAQGIKVKQVHLDNRAEPALEDLQDKEETKVTWE